MKVIKSFLVVAGVLVATFILWNVIGDIALFVPAGVAMVYFLAR